MKDVKTGCQKILQEFSARISAEFQVKKLIVYSSSVAETVNLFGDTLDSLTLERYLSFSCTKIIVSSSGSKLITRFDVHDCTFLFIFLSDIAEAFAGTEPKYIIEELLTLKRKIGEIE